MRDKIDLYARRLEGLSTAELSREAENLLLRERRITAALIAHLAEISRRKGHLELGYRTLFDYCVIHLRLGKGSVWNRTQVAKVSIRFPEVLEHLAEGKVSLSSLGVLATHLSEENVERLLAQAEGKTKEEVREIVRAISVSTEDRTVRAARPGWGWRSITRGPSGKEGRAARRTFGCCAAGIISSVRSGSSGRSS